MVFLFVFCLLLFYVRLYFGVDLTDEAYGIALPYRFSLGDKPFIDELHFHQFTGVILSPFYQVFNYFSKDSAGIVLYSRHLFFVFWVSIAFLAYHSIKKWLDRDAALILSASWMFYVPFALPNLSYNTIGSAMFTAGLFWDFLKEDERGKGIFHGVAVLCYPPLIAAAAFCFFLSLYKKRSYKDVVIYALFVGLPLFLLLLTNGIGFSQLQKMLEQTRELRAASGYGPFSEKVTEFFTSLISFLYWGPGVFILFLALWWIRSKNIVSTVFAFIASLFPIVVFLASRPSWGGMGPRGVIIFWGLFAPLFLWDRNKLNQQVFWQIWLPNIVAAFVFVGTSGNGFGSLAIAIFPAALVGVGSVFLQVKSRIESPKNLIAPLLFLLSLGLYMHLCFGDLTVFQLKQQVSQGAYRGIFTTESKKKTVEELNSDLNTLEIQSGRLLMYPHFLGGYLMTRMRPLTRMLWNSSTHTRVWEDIAYRDLNGKTESVICLVFRLMVGSRVMEYRYEKPPFQSFLEENFIERIRRPDYVCYSAK